MSLQTSTITQYKTAYPQDKLKDIAKKTQTQITRVFRILNGAEMKLCEYERFNRVINLKINNNKLNSLVTDCIEKLNPSRKLELENSIARLLKNEEAASITSFEKRKSISTKLHGAF